MEAEFWHERWRSGQIGFHQASADRNLTRHWSVLDLPRGSRVFVPLCGKSLDMLWLRDEGHPVIGIDLSAIALEAFLMENGIPARRRVQEDFDIYETPEFRLYRGDYFALTAADLKDVAAVYDRAALIAWAPEMRSPYVGHLAALVRPGTQMLLITMEYLQPQMAGPPFSVMREEVERLYAPYFTLHEVDRQDILANGRGGARAASRIFSRSPITWSAGSTNSTHGRFSNAGALSGACPGRLRRRGSAGLARRHELTIDRLFDAPSLAGPSIVGLEDIARFLPRNVSARQTGGQRSAGFVGVQHPRRPPGCWWTRTSLAPGDESCPMRS